MRRFLALTVISLVVTLGGAPARASTTPVDLDEVAAALRADPVYVDANAERSIGDGEIDELRSEIRGANTPVYVAVLPAAAADAAGGDPAEVARLVAQAVDRPGTFGVVVGDSFRAGSSELPAGRAADLAQASLDAQGDDTAAVLVDFVDRVGDAAADGSANGSVGSADGSGDDGGTSLLLPALLVGGAGLAGFFVWRSSRRRRTEAAERARAEEADRQLLRAGSPCSPTTWSASNPRSSCTPMHRPTSTPR